MIREFRVALLFIALPVLLVFFMFWVYTLIVGAHHTQPFKAAVAFALIIGAIDTLCMVFDEGDRR